MALLLFFFLFLLYSQLLAQCHEYSKCSVNVYWMNRRILYDACFHHTVISHRKLQNITEKFSIYVVKALCWWCRVVVSIAYWMAPKESTENAILWSVKQIKFIYLVKLGTSIITAISMAETSSFNRFCWSLKKRYCIVFFLSSRLWNNGYKQFKGNFGPLLS